MLSNQHKVYPEVPMSLERLHVGWRGRPETSRSIDRLHLIYHDHIPSLDPIRPRSETIHVDRLMVNEQALYPTSHHTAFFLLHEAGEECRESVERLATPWRACDEVDHGNK